MQNTCYHFTLKEKANPWICPCYLQHRILQALHWQRGLASLGKVLHPQQHFLSESKMIIQLTHFVVACGVSQSAHFPVPFVPAPIVVSLTALPASSIRQPEITVIF